jgi:hypothetical protein
MPNFERRVIFYLSDRIDRIFRIYLIYFVFNFHRKDAESAKKRYFSFAVERTAKEKNQSLRDILGL